MNANPQMDLDLPGGPEEKSYPGANGVKLRYWEQDDKIIRIALSDKLILPVTYQKGGHIYTDVPSYGRIEFRGKNAKTSFLSRAAALSHWLSRSREITESIAVHTESIAVHNESIAGHNQSIVRDLEEQRELGRKAEAKALELEKENDRLKEENARLAQNAAAPKPEGSSPLRNDVRLIRPKLAIKLGVPAAVVFEQLCFLIRIGVFRIIDGEQYVTHTSKEWVDKFFPFYSEWTVERAFKVLEKEKLVVSKQADGRDNRVKSYRPSPEGSKLLPSGQEKRANCQDAREQITARKGANCSLPSYIESDSSTTTATKKAQLYAIAATTTGIDELAEKLKPFFPLHNVVLEKRAYLKYRDVRELAITGPTFVHWMLGAQPRLSPPKPKPKHKPPAAPIAHEHEEQIDPEQHAKFLKELEDHKTRKAAKHAKALLQPE